MSPSRIIGGMFGLDDLLPSHPTSPPFLSDGRTIMLLNARSGIWLLIGQLSPSQTWLPSYLCPSVLQGVNPHRTRVRFYPVDYDLRISTKTWIDEVRAGDLVVLIDYFGFPCDRECARLARERGARVVEDACQALLSGGVGLHADFVLFSPRKFLGVPDGGVLILKSGADMPDVPLASPPVTWSLKALEIAILRREFDRYGGSRRWFELSREDKRDCPVGAYAMSELSHDLLVHGFDYQAIARRRRQNYSFLADELSEVALFPDLPPEVVPLGFPIRVAERERIRNALFDAGIFPPVHWEIRGCVPEGFRESHRLSEEIMTLLCDQRYDQEDLCRMVSRLGNQHVSSS